MVGVWSAGGKGSCEILNFDSKESGDRELERA